MLRNLVPIMGMSIFDGISDAVEHGLYVNMIRIGPHTREKKKIMRY